MTAIMERERPESNCAYCLGERCPCDCTDDCGARDGLVSNFCPRAEGYLDWLASLGLYSEEEIESLRKQGYK
jgi:hypothetical protein